MAAAANSASCARPPPSPRVAPVDLGDTASGLDRRHLQLLLAAISHADRRHEQRDIDDHGFPGDLLLPLVPWPAQD